MPVTQNSAQENCPIWRSKYFKSDLLLEWYRNSNPTNKMFFYKATSSDQAISIMAHGGICIYVYIHICTNIHTHIYIHIYLRTYIYMYKYIHIYILIYIHIDIYTYSYIYTFIYIHKQSLFWKAISRWTEIPNLNSFWKYNSFFSAKKINVLSERLPTVIMITSDTKSLKKKCVVLPAGPLQGGYFQKKEMMYKSRWVLRNVVS